MFVCFALSGATGFLDVTSSLHVTVDRISIYSFSDLIQHPLQRISLRKLLLATLRRSRPNDLQHTSYAPSATNKGPSNLSKAELKRDK